MAWTSLVEENLLGYESFASTLRSELEKALSLSYMYILSFRKYNNVQPRTSNHYHYDRQDHASPFCQSLLWHSDHPSQSECHLPEAFTELHVIAPRKRHSPYRMPQLVHCNTLYPGLQSCS